MLERNARSVSGNCPRAKPKRENMKAENINSYVDEQVRRLSDAKVRPFVESINNELTRIRENDARKAALDKENEECEKRITEYQKFIREAQAQVDELAKKLADATNVAVS
jgi:predicted RNase H-like nuclease (RuvC/YqgF family)